MECHACWNENTASHRCERRRNLQIVISRALKPRSQRYKLCDTVCGGRVHEHDGSKGQVSTSELTHGRANEYVPGPGLGDGGLLASAMVSVGQ